MNTSSRRQVMTDRKKEVRRETHLTRVPRLDGDVKKAGLETKRKTKQDDSVYHKDGSLMASGNMVDGKMEGFWQWFRKNGTKMRTGYFKLGKQTGVWTTYDKKGKVVKITKFA